MDSKRTRMTALVREFWAAKRDWEHCRTRDPVDAERCRVRMDTANNDIVILDVLGPGERMPTVDEIESPWWQNRLGNQSEVPESPGEIIADIIQQTDECNGWRAF